MIGVFHLLSLALAGFSVALLLPAAIGLAVGENHSAAIFVVVAGLVGFLAGGAYFALRDRTRSLDRVAGYVLVVCVWVIPPLLAAIPLMRIADTTYVTALFESVSGYTTTGASALKAIAPLGFSGIFFRAELQWLGGLMTLLTIVAVISPSGLGGIPRVALVASTDRHFNRLGATLRQITLTYLTITVACAALLLATSIPPFEAVCLALSTVSTGGFMPIQGNLSVYDSTLAEFIIAIFMLIGATSIVWHRMMLEGRWSMMAKHRESYWTIAMALLAGLVYAVGYVVQRSGSDAFSFLDSLRDGFFTGASLVSTTGFDAHASGLAALPLPIVLLFALIGGSAISTAGGIKYYRVGGMLTLSLQELRRLVYPHSIRTSRLGSALYDLAQMKSIWSSLVASLAVIVAAALLIATSEPNFDGALTAAIAAFSNVGPVYSTGWPAPDAWPAYADFSAFAKLVMIATMILGRIEVLVLLGALNLAYWRS
ncbi:MAG: TrkH family potassium uptake protein [Bauldia sp.]|uniref:TrkH family potassium uptake protein n=1 Tax=Bauldia sp. TaxID=2575872 RepID=UPI001D8A4BD3|nr:potassium transporter TrkG [Bauldia sp.]MCB1497104.1 TrkH family potassium uptake protein [Bauldia sp.]